MVLSFFSSRTLAEKFSRATGKDLAELAPQMHGLLPDTLKGYATLGRSIQEAVAEVERTPLRRASPKIGRNDNEWNGTEYLPAKREVPDDKIADAVFLP
jgi:hypothetical protein